MTAWVGLLYSVILPGRRVTGRDLLAVAALNGWGAARTVIASGNLLFEAEGSEADLAAGLSAAMGKLACRAIPAFLRSAEDWRSLVASNPFAGEAAEDPANVAVRVMALAPDPALVEALRPRARPGEAVALGPRAIWVAASGQGSGAAPGGLSTSPLVRALGQNRIGAGTWRNASAVARITAALG